MKKVRQSKKVAKPKKVDVAEMPQRVALRPAQFAAAISISRPMLYTLEIQPRSVKLGSARLIVERPEDYLKRVAAFQAAAA